MSLREKSLPRFPIFVPNRRSCHEKDNENESKALPHPIETAGVL